MPITPVGSTLNILKTLQTDATGSAKRLKGGTRRARTESEDAEAALAPGLREELSQLIAGIDAGDQAQIAAVRPSLIRSIVARDLGESVERHPEWPHLLHRIEAELARDAYVVHWQELIRFLQAK